MGMNWNNPHTRQNSQKVNSHKVGSNFKGEELCSIYEPHSMDEKLFNFLREVSEEVEDVKAVGCSSCNNANVFYVQQTQNRHVQKIYLKYDELEKAEQIYAIAQEKEGLTTVWNGKITKSVFVGVEEVEEPKY